MACLGKGPIVSHVGVVMISLKRIIWELSLLVNCCTRWLVYILLFVVLSKDVVVVVVVLLLDRGGHGRRGS